MREILFRGKRTDNGEWVYGSYVEAKNSWHKFGLHAYWIIPMAFANGGWFAIAQRFPVVGDTVGQYTGLNDRNGNRIFENDLVTIPQTKRQGLPGEVRYNKVNATFEIQRIGYNAIPLDSDDGIYEIVGNVIDNPELLK